MADKLMHIPNDDTQNCPFCKITVNNWLYEPTNQNLKLFASE